MLLALMAPVSCSAEFFNKKNWKINLSLICGISHMSMNLRIYQCQTPVRANINGGFSTGGSRVWLYLICECKLSKSDALFIKKDIATVTSLILVYSEKWTAFTCLSRLYYSTHCCLAWRVLFYDLNDFDKIVIILY